MINLGNNFVDFIYINDRKRRNTEKQSPDARNITTGNAKGKNKKNNKAEIREKKETPK